MSSKEKNMSDVLTMAEIERTYDGEWVLIGDPETDDSMRVIRGTVLYHNRDRDTFDRESLKFHPKRFAVVSLRAAPEGMEYVL
jgi:hypothetical protein